MVVSTLHVFVFVCIVAVASKAMSSVYGSFYTIWNLYELDLANSMRLALMGINHTEWSLCAHCKALHNTCIGLASSTRREREQLCTRERINTSTFRLLTALSTLYTHKSLSTSCSESTHLCYIPICMCLCMNIIWFVRNCKLVNTNTHTNNKIHSQL